MTASHQTMSRQTPTPANPSSSTRNSAVKAAALTPVAMNAVTGVGAPSYTSGAHMWNGTAATLNANPTSSSARPAGSMTPVPPSPTWTPMSVRFVVPVAPYTNAMPYRRNPDANAPSRKY